MIAARTMKRMRIIRKLLLARRGKVVRAQLPSVGGREGLSEEGGVALPVVGMW